MMGSQRAVLELTDLSCNSTCSNVVIGQYYHYTWVNVQVWKRKFPSVSKLFHCFLAFRLPISASWAFWASHFYGLFDIFLQFPGTYNVLFYIRTSFTFCFPKFCSLYGSSSVVFLICHFATLNHVFTTGSILAPSCAIFEFSSYCSTSFTSNMRGKYREHRCLCPVAQSCSCKPDCLSHRHL